MVTLNKNYQRIDGDVDTVDLIDDRHNTSMTEVEADMTTIETELTADEAHRNSTSNPHGVTKSQVGLGNVDNTSDANKPVSTAQQTALDGKISHSLATAVNDFLVASGVGVFVKKTVAEVKAILGLGSAAYTASTDYTPAAHASNTSNPHSVTATQVGKDTAQWNAQKINGITVNDLTGIADTNVLKYQSSTGKFIYGPASVVANLSDLADVTIASLSDGHVLTWDAATSKWKNKIATAASLASLANINDVLLSSPANNEVLTYETSSSKWKNKPVSGASIIKGETPSGTVNGSNTVFTTAYGFVAGKVTVYKNGVRMNDGGNDFTSSAGNIITFVTAPATGDVILVDYVRSDLVLVGGTSYQNVNETPTGTVNGTNTVFTTAANYIAGTIQVFLNGVLQTKTTDYTESATNAITFITAPATGDDIKVTYQTALTPAGNADTVDSYHALGLIIDSVQRQAIVNGGMEVSLEDVTGTKALANNTAKYACDLFSVTPSGTAVSAGTQGQISNSALSTSGYSLKISGATITGSGTIVWKYRIEAMDAKKYKNQIASFSSLVLHDVGSNINYLITIRKANSADNFSATTEIANSGNLSVASATNTLIKLESISMGDCSNGIEVEVKAICGAVTTKNFEIAEWQFNKGTQVLPFTCGNFAEELAKVQRYYEKSYDNSVTIGTANGNGSIGWKNQQLNSYPFITVFYKSEKRVVVSPTLYSTNSGASGKIYNAGGAVDVNATNQNTGARQFQAVVNNVSVNPDSPLYVHFVADARFTA